MLENVSLKTGCQIPLPTQRVCHVSSCCSGSESHYINSLTSSRSLVPCHQELAHLFAFWPPSLYESAEGLLGSGQPPLLRQSAGLVHQTCYEWGRKPVLEPRYVRVQSDCCCGFHESFRSILRRKSGPLVQSIALQYYSPLVNALSRLKGGRPVLPLSTCSRDWLMYMIWSLKVQNVI